MKIDFSTLTGKVKGLPEPSGHVLSALKSVVLNGGLYIDGKSLESISGATMPTRSPISSEWSSNVSCASQKDVDKAVENARNAFSSGIWSKASLQNRKKVMLKIADLIQENLDQFSALDCFDAGKPFSMAKGIDVPVAIDTFRWYAELTDKLHGQTAPTDNLDVLLREPIGVIGAVTPWNYPLMITAWKIAPMLAAGNSVILKPSEHSPLSALMLAKVASEAGLPDGVLNVVNGTGETTGSYLGLHNDVDAIGFTGSSRVGKKFLEYSGQSNMKIISLECGGKSPMIVLEDADPAQAANAMASAVFYNSGQSCNAPARAILHESVKEKFIEELKALIPQYMPGNSLDSNSSVGAVINKFQLDRIKGFIDRAVKEGAILEYGGNIIHEDTGGFYIEPTIIRNTSQKMEINREEVFGPVIPIQTFSDTRDAVAIANDIDYGLWANVWTNDLSEALGLSRALNAGTVAFNTVWGGG